MKPPELTLERAVAALTQDSEDALVTAASFIQKQCFSSADARKMVRSVLCLYAWGMKVVRSVLCLYAWGMKMVRSVLCLYAWGMKMVRPAVGLYSWGG